MKRYYFEDVGRKWYPDFQLVECEDGDWAEYKDVEAKIKELEDEIQQLENMRDDELLED